MNTLNPLLHALRGTAERGLAHFRPPGGAPRPGGAAAWKRSTGTHARSPLPPPSRSSHSAFPTSKAKKDAALQRMLRCVIDHALTPVFRGLKTQAGATSKADFAAIQVRNIIRSAKDGSSTKGNSYRRAHQSKTFTRSSHRPQVTLQLPVQRLCDEVGLQTARKSQFHQSFSQFVVAPQSVTPLGLRAAADELEDKLKNYGRERKANTRRTTPRRSSTRRSGSFPHKDDQMKLAHAVGGVSIAAAAKIAEEKLKMANERLDQASTSASYPALRAADDQFEDSIEDVWRMVPPTPTWVVTTLMVPMNPDLVAILATDLQQEPGRADEDVFRIWETIGNAVNDYRLRIIVPLERALVDGHMSSLLPRSWTPGALYMMVDDNDQSGQIALPIRFVNHTRSDVEARMIHDVTPSVFTWLSQFFTEEYYPDTSDDGEEEDQHYDGNFVHTSRRDDDNGKSGSSFINGSAISSPPDVDSLEDSMVDVEEEVNDMGIASQTSMGEHGQGFPGAHHALFASVGAPTSLVYPHAPQ